MSAGPTATVSAVIPTRGRPAQVVRAARSALQQTHAPAEVVVVVDGPDPGTEAALAAMADDRVRVVVLPQNGGPGAARNAGIAAASGEWIALLDDDDEWLPAKLQQQLAHVQASPGDAGRIVCATVAEWRIDGQTYLWPTRTIREGEPIGDYMFVRSRAGEGLLALPTVLLPRALAVAHPFPEGLATHEEWAWYLQLEAAGARWSVLMQPLAVVHAPRARRSVSTRSTWRDSLSWARAHRHLLSDRAFSDFCLTEVARSARGSRDALGVARAGLTAMQGSVNARGLLRFGGLALMPSALRRRLHAVARTRRPASPPALGLDARAAGARARRDS